VRVLGAALLMAALCLPGLATAAPPDSVQVVFMEAYAHNLDDEMDPRLRPMADALRMAGFTGYEFVSGGKWTVGEGDSNTVTLESGYTLQIRLDEIGEDSARLTVWMTRPNHDDPARIRIRINRNAATVIGGNDYKKGKLVVPIRVRYPSGQ
jgi:hypothetical protein